MMIGYVPSKNVGPHPQTLCFKEAIVTINLLPLKEIDRKKGI